MGEDKKSNTADESTSLLADESTRSGYSESSSTGVSYDGTAEEFSVVAGSPWPSTFEHSIALLGGPTTDVDFIDQITRSPRIIPVQAQTARVSVSSCFLRILLFVYIFNPHEFETL